MFFNAISGSMKAEKLLMAPSRKSKSVNARFSYINDVAPKKDGENASKNKQRKRKLSDMLGSQWSKEELQHFYGAYRKYGKDWKKVAAVVRNRSVEMVEALYSMNRAYLSLPEGTASVAGLIAMMTDHYCVLEGSDSEQESDDCAGASRKLQKRGRGKFRHSPSKGLDGLSDLSNSLPVGSTFACLSLLNKRRPGGSRPRAVGKRTPRVPVSYSYDKDSAEKYFPPRRQGFKLKTDANDDDVAHEIAVALTEASQRGGSPQVSHKQKRKKENVMSSPVHNAERMMIASELAVVKLRGSELDEGGFEGSLGSAEADNRDYAREGKYLMDTERVCTVEVQKKGKKFYGKQPEVDIGISHVDDVKEACSGTEGQILGAVRGKHQPEAADAKNARSSSKGPRKRSKKLLFGADESSAFDALQTLADLSLMMPAGNDTEQEGEKVKISGAKEKGNYLIPGVEVTALQTSKLGKVSDLDCSILKSNASPVNVMQKRKQKSFASKLQNLKIGASNVPHLSDAQKMEVTNEVKKSTSKGKRSSNNATHPKQGQTGKPPEQSSSSTAYRWEWDDNVASNVQILFSNQVNLPTTKDRSRRKMHIQKPTKQIEIKASENIVKEQQLSIRSVHDGAFDVKEKLSNCLSWYRVQQWCTFEWFYSAIDYPWFAKREFVEYLDHVGLGHIPRLTRVEWGVIRSSLGKPRRFSQQFLKEEKEKLNQYRDSVRTHYSELRAGIREGLPADLARPLSVGQHVIAIHPRTREIHDGRVLTVDHCLCRIQFDRPELGVEFVKDVDCMPLNPLDNIPASLTRYNVAVNKFFEKLNERKMNERLEDQNLGGYKKCAPIEKFEMADDAHISPSTFLSSNLSKQGGTSHANLQAKVGPGETANALQVTNCQPSILVQIQAKEADVQALLKLTRALDKKEAVVSELRRMNDEVLESQKDGDNSLKDSESFKKQYAAVLLQLHEVNEQVASSLRCLRQRNTYQGTSMLLKSMASLGAPNGFSNSFAHAATDTPKSGSNVVEIVESSRMKARTMVNAAMQAMSTLKEGGDGVERIEEAIDYLNNQLSLDEARMPTMRSTVEDSVNGSLSSKDQLMASQPTDPKSNNVFDRNEAQIPSELVAHCVSTLLMIQKCTERQFPPADVAHILDSAVTSLQPCCSQNVPIFVEIQKCMGIIRSQILALIPT